MEQGAAVSGPTSLVRLVFFPNATRIESEQFIVLIKEVGQIFFLKRGGLFSVFPNLGRKVIKSATNKKICFLICPS